MSFVVTTERQPPQGYEAAVLSNDRMLIQQSVAWTRLLSFGKDLPFFISVKNERGEYAALLTTYLFRSQSASLLLSTPEAGGYGGIVIMKDFASQQEILYPLLLERLVALAKEENCQLCTICTPPFFSDDGLYQKSFAPDFIRENFYQYLELDTDPLLALPSKRRSNLKRKLRIAEEAGCLTRFDDGSLPQSVRSFYFEQWYAIHCKRLSELEALPISREFFLSCFKEIIDSGNGFFTYVFDRHEKLIGGALAVGCGQVADLFILSCDRDYFHTQSNTLLVQVIIKELQKRKFCILNWQSCSDKQSGVYQYKEEWGAKVSNHFYLTRITGDITSLKKTPITQIKEEFRGHYVAPYELFNYE